MSVTTITMKCKSNLCTFINCRCVLADTSRLVMNVAGKILPSYLILSICRMEKNLLFFAFLCIFPVGTRASVFQQLPEITNNNGALPLLINSLTDQLLDEMQADKEIALTEAQAFKLRTKLKGLYNMLKDHPALAERRLWVGSHKPPIPAENIQAISKKSNVYIPAQPVCPSRTEWRMVYFAKDLNGSEVEVFQPIEGQHGQQWFYTVTCNYIARNLVSTTPGSFFNFNAQPTYQRTCRGIRNAEFHSECLTKKSYVMALAKKPNERVYDWIWIQVDTSCNCAITPKRLPVVGPLVGRDEAEASAI